MCKVKDQTARNNFMENQNSQIVIYKDPNGNIKIDVRFEDETVWLTHTNSPTI